MYFTFSKNPIDRIKIWIWNKREKYSSETLRSADTDFSPIEAGWDRMKDHPTWICHRCISHRNFKPYIKRIDEDERRAWEQIKKRNQNISHVIDQEEANNLLARKILGY